MGFNCADGDSKLCRDFLIYLSLRQVADNFDLTVCWPDFISFCLLTMVFGLEEPFKNNFGDLGCQRSLALNDILYRFDEEFREVRLQDVSLSASLQGPLNHVV